MGSDSWNLFDKAAQLGEPARHKKTGEEDAEPPPAGLPASIKKDICPNRALDQYIHTNTGASFVRSSQQSTWGTAAAKRGGGRKKRDIIKYRKSS